MSDSSPPKMGSPSKEPAPPEDRVLVPETDEVGAEARKSRSAFSQSSQEILLSWQ